MAEKKKTEREVLLYEPIGGWWGYTARRLIQEVKDADVRKVHLRINSPGGDVTEGLAIYNYLRSLDYVRVTVDGLAASAASFVAMAGHEVKMPCNAFMMMHNPAGIVQGESEDMRHTADVLDKMRDAIANIYARRSGKSVVDVAAMMDEETWMNGEEACEMGFADEVIDAVDADNLLLFNLADFTNLPQTLRAAADGWKFHRVEFPLSDKQGWDGAGARKSLEKWATKGEKVIWSKYRQGFLAWDSSSPEKRESYKLPIAEVEDGEPKIVRGGVRAALSRIPNTDVPENVRKAATAHCQALMERFEKKGGKEKDFLTAEGAEGAEGAERDDIHILASADGEEVFIAFEDAQSTTVQTIICSKDRFKSAEDAKKWVVKNGFKASKVDETEESYRFRQREPDEFKPGSFRTIVLTKGVKAVVGKLKKEAAQSVGPTNPLLGEEETDVTPEELTQAIQAAVQPLVDRVGQLESERSAAAAQAQQAAQQAELAAKAADVRARLLSARWAKKDGRVELTAAGNLVLPDAVADAEAQRIAALPTTTERDFAVESVMRQPQVAALVPVGGARVPSPVRSDGGGVLLNDWQRKYMTDFGLTEEDMVKFGPGNQGVTA